MKRLILLTIAAAIIALSPAYAIQIEAPEESPADFPLTVLVLNDSGYPLDNSTVTFTGIESMPVVQFTEMGRCVYKPTTGGTLNITAEFGNESSSILINIYNPEKDGISIKVPQEGRIGETMSIIIINNDGDVVRNAIVTISGIDPLPIVQYSNEKGEVRYRPLKTGEFTITAEKGDYISGKTIKVTAGSPVTSGASPGGGGGGGGNNFATSFITRIGKGEKATAKFSEDLSPNIHEIEIKVKGEVYSLGLTVKYPSKKPYGTSDIGGEVYKFLEIVPSRVLKDDDIERCIIKFKVPKEWLETNNFDRAIIIRYHDGSWEELETFQTGEDDMFLYFEAITPGFSYFAIIGEKQIVTIPSIPSTNIQTTTPTVEPEPENIIESEPVQISEEEPEDLEQESQEEAGFPVFQIVLIGCLAAGAGYYYRITAKKK